MKFSDILVNKQIKTLLLIIAGILFSVQLNAQEKKNHDFFIHNIDSLIYSAKFEDNVEAPNEEYWEFYNLSISDQNRVIDYVLTLFDQDEYINLYFLARGLLVTFFDKRTDQSIQNRISEIYLDRAFYTYTSEINRLGNVGDYSDRAKSRLLDIAEDRRTPEDEKAQRMLAVEKVDEFWGIHHREEEVRRIMQQKSKKAIRKSKSMKAQLMDSVRLQQIEKEIMSYKMWLSLYTECILSMGSSNDRRFIPGLEYMLNKEYYPVDLSTDYLINSTREACIYALAKLNVQKYKDEIFDNRQDIDYQYLDTQEAYVRYLKANFVWNEPARFKLPGKAFPKAFVIIVDAMDYYVKNTPKELKISYMEVEGYVAPPENEIIHYDPQKDEQNRIIIQKIYKLYQWLIDHEGHLEFSWKS